MLTPVVLLLLKQSTFGWVSYQKLLPKPFPTIWRICCFDTDTFLKPLWIHWDLLKNVSKIPAPRIWYLLFNSYPQKLASGVLHFLLYNFRSECSVLQGSVLYGDPGSAVYGSEQVRYRTFQYLCVQIASKLNIFFCAQWRHKLLFVYIVTG